MSLKGDFKKKRKQAEAAGWRVEKKKEYWLFYPPMPPGADRLDQRYRPCRIAGTPSSQAQWRNFLACLKRKGLG